MAARLTRGDVHLCQFPTPDKQRPALILTRDTVLNRLSNITVAPITSTIRGAATEVLLNTEDGMKAPCAINLHNINTLSIGRIGPRVATLSPQKLREACAALTFALGCDADS